ncbi:hypothetical protein LCGC14_2583890 [marine sediment metagenome]|uniref:Uncharacterized protein n=1 Tax=marine sediment metagenome TaxID=412755 RepID=A0A0F9AE08_9ZZZZ
MLTPEDQKTLNDSEDMKLAVDGLRALFRPDGNEEPKHRKALDALARFCKVDAYNHGTDQTEILRITGRREVYNFIMFCLEYPETERRKLVAEIRQLEDIRDGRRSDTDDD